MKKVIADDLNFKEEVLQEVKPLMVEFFATWCIHCQHLEPIINDLHRKYGDKIKFVQVDIDKTPYYANEMSVTATPTLFFYKDGKSVRKIVGPRTKDMIEHTLKSLL